MDENSNKLPDEEKPISNSEEDGRNKEWQDRARVNIDQTPEGTHTNVERDFEPESLEQSEKKEIPPAY